PLTLLVIATGLIGLTRLDALLLVLPALLVSVRGQPTRGVIARLAVGFLPLVGWHLFSFAYYGFLFPNTAYAKLNLHIPLTDLLRQGRLYYVDSAANDPLTLLVIATGLISSLWGGWVERALGLGIALYLAYILRIGGDFMSGRFFVAPFVIGIALVGLWRAWADPRKALAAAVVALAAALVWPGSRLRSGAAYGAGINRSLNVGQDGIADERGYYYPSTGLLNVWRRRKELAAASLPVPPYGGSIQGARAAAASVHVTTQGEVGFFGYFAGPDVYVLDRFALADALLARLPFEQTRDWRVGHYARRRPAGYDPSVLGDSKIVDPRVREYNHVLQLITRAPVWSSARWRAIARMQLGLGPAAPPKDYR
ncbi:MAG: hypothetical protein ACLQVI_04820, partial [Polyangiaceae bacterium]